MFPFTFQYSLILLYFGNLFAYKADLKVVAKLSTTFRTLTYFIEAAPEQFQEIHSWFPLH
jgi:hypothetical protein